MNEDRVVGAGRELLGKAERGVGDATGSEKLKGDGAVDQFGGTVQHGFGVVKDKVANVIDDAPGAVAGAIDKGRELGQQGSEGIRERLGDNGPLYLIGGAIALFALGAFALTRSPAKSKPTKPAPRRRSAKPARKNG